MSVDEYEQILKAQGGGCAICGGQNRNGRALGVDHNHLCCPGDGGGYCGQCNRGILCSDCNNALGFFRDDPLRMISAIDYLKKNPL